MTPEAVRLELDAEEPLACATCGRLLEGLDPEDEPDGDAGRPICGECNRERNFAAIEEVELGEKRPLQDPEDLAAADCPDLDADVLWRTVLMGQAEDGAVRIEIRPSARRHRINDERIRYVIEHCPLPIDSPQWPGQTMFLGPDQHGNRLEVVGVEDDEGVLWVIHAMKLRSAYDDAYDEVDRHR